MGAWGKSLNFSAVKWGIWANRFQNVYSCLIPKIPHQACWPNSGERLHDRTNCWGLYWASIAFIHPRSNFLSWHNNTQSFLWTMTPRLFLGHMGKVGWVWPLGPRVGPWPSRGQSIRSCRPVIGSGMGMWLRSAQWEPFLGGHWNSKWLSLSG